MKQTFLLLLFSLVPHIAISQTHSIDSLKKALVSHPKVDTTRINLLNELARQIYKANGDSVLPVAKEAFGLAVKLQYTHGQIAAVNKIGDFYIGRSSYDSAMKYYRIAENLAASVNDTAGLGHAYLFIGEVYYYQAKYPLALEYSLKAADLFEKIGDKKTQADIMGNIGIFYSDMGDLENAEKYYSANLKAVEHDSDPEVIVRATMNLGNNYLDRKLFAKGDSLYSKALFLAEKAKSAHWMAFILRNLSTLRTMQNKYNEAALYALRSYHLYDSIKESDGVSDAMYVLADAYSGLHKPDSAIYYGKKSLALMEETGLARNVYGTYEVLASAYAEKNNYADAYKYEKKFAESKDSLKGEDLKNQMATIKYQSDLDKKQSEIELLRKDKLLQEQEVQKQRIKAYSLGGIVALVGLLFLLQVRNNRRKQHMNSILREQKEELQNSFQKLKQTQAQLIQSEKMASLGELTAGIAHEIQNPLNFVNNFSDVNTELLQELQQEIENANYPEVKTIAKELETNQNKITYHGKRADSIVKGMLQHARQSSGKKEPTNINKLADEYLRLSYQGLRAKDNAFDARIETSFDDSLGEVNIAAQDIGRVLRNLFNNAFYSVNQKKQLLNGTYEATVSVRTNKEESNVQIIVQDNGSGIPQKLQDKIFQPFFTTKPTGEGTGLGLSLSYDIITKGHGGELKVQSKEGEGSTFVVSIPAN